MKRKEGSMKRGGDEKKDIDEKNGDERRER